MSKAHASGYVRRGDIRTRHAPVTPVAPIDRARVSVGLMGFCLVAVGFVLIVRRLPDNAAHSLFACALGIILIPTVGSPVEWFVHRFVYHEPVIRPLRPIFTVHTAHHFAFFPTSRYVTGGPARRLAIRRRSPDAHLAPLRNARVRLAHFSWYMAISAVVVWIPAWAASHDAAFLVGLVVSSAVCANLFIVVHDTIHRPGSHRFVEAQPWFAFLDRHHYIHHVDLGSNVNFLLPLADWVFGTLRTQLTPQELSAHGTLEDAKAHLVGAGERVRHPQQ
jgi:hypothetical protein